MSHVFISYAREDQAQVKDLYAGIKSAGFEPWMDQVNLLAGEDWEYRIRDAITTAALFIACLSTTSVSKRGVVQKEFKLALEVLQACPEHAVYFIPIRLDRCEIPGAMTRLHCLDLFEPSGMEKLVTALRTHLGIHTRRLAPALRQFEQGLKPRSPERSIDYKERGREEVRKWGEQMTAGHWDWHKLGNALEDYLEAIRYDPEHQHAWTNIAYVYYLIGQQAMAEKCMARAYQLAGPGPNHPGRNYKNVREAINRGLSISGYSFSRPAMPDSFKAKYKDFLDLGVGAEATFRDIERYLRLSFGTE